ncbi:helix-turn-helix transcriptional regulator [Actinoplanes sp. NPDC049118]|uniref:helix-turn-helix domain-containing protein n=1 Tax=Actinoplanes sp. NPDC049118 TaxID=3155769 RepID=UPI0033F7CBB3
MVRATYIPRTPHRLLVARLKQMRQEHGLTPADLAAQSKINPTQLSRLESLTRPPVASQVLALCHFYKLDERTTAELMALAEPVRGDHDGWSRFDLETMTARYLTFESDSKGVLTYQSMLIPGLLQEESYATAVVNSLRSYLSDEQITETVASRMERRRNLLPPRSLKFHAIIDEAVLLRRLGGKQGMRRQLEHLLEATQLPNVIVQILPISSGPHPGLNGSFSIFTFGQDLLGDFAYVEDQIGQTFEDRDDIVALCKSNFSALATLAATPNESTTMIEQRLSWLESDGTEG